MLHGAMVRATFLATALQDKLHEQLHRVTGRAFKRAIFFHICLHFKSASDKNK